MNAIQQLTAISILNDREGSARFLDEQYMYAINAAIGMIIDDRTDNIKKPKRYSFESVQRVRDELYTLVPPTVSIAPVGNILAYPADYNHFLKLQCTIDGVTKYSRPTNYNESGPLLENPWKKPSNTKTYFEQNVSGFNILRGATGTFTAGLLDYIKIPDTVSIGNDSNKINPGASVLVPGQVYVAYEDAVHAGATYVVGTVFTASVVSLTSGIVILNSVVVNCNLPVKLHEEVNRLASAIMNGTIEDLSKKQDLMNDNQQA
jgi:hypothetical protein